ncbi:vWA domain-containing protein [Nioella halotolerans]|uniref:vWA domain-containing protein n=1 Tax=Nioella halotolerans TaxID=2303578 RepID=UPI0026B49774
MAAATVGTAQEAPRAMLILDGSGSMWGQIDGTPKIEIARDAISDMLDGWQPGRQIGLMAYGHREQGNCTDIETLLPPAPLDRPGFEAILDGITPLGRTPLTEATRRAAEALAFTDAPATVILVSDGRETCNADPCDAAEVLERTGADFTAHVIGFDVDDAAQADLSCLAEATGGMYLAATDAEELTGALQEVTEAKPEPVVPLIEDRFERAELGESWEVITPDPANYILDGGTLLTLTTEPTYVGQDNQTNVFRWAGQPMPEGDWDMSIDFTSDFTTRRSTIEMGIYEDPDNFVTASLFGDGSSNDRVVLQVKSVVNGEASRSNVTFADDACCPRDYDIDAVLANMSENGGTLTLQRRGRDYIAEIETDGWVARDGQENPLRTEPLTVLRAGGDPVLFSGTFGRDYGDLPQTATAFDRFTVVPR